MSCLNNFKYLIVISFLLLSSGFTTAAQTSVFNYQGRLQDAGTPANGSYDFQFRLLDALSGGNQVGPTLIRDDVAVASGVFTVSLDFGAAAFPGGDRFLEIGVRPGVSTGTFTVLSPLQFISSTPYALRSTSASAADVATTATNALQLGGVTASQYVVTSDSRLTDARSPTAGSSNYVQNTTAQQASSNFNISGNGTAGGTLQANIVRATNQYRIGNFTDPVLSASGANLFVGIGSGIANTGFNNTFAGNNAGRNNTSGVNNAFFGTGAGVNNTTAGANAFFGFNAGAGTVGGGSNSFFGYSAGLFNTAGAQNSFFGEAAGGQTTTGSFNSFFGNTTGISNTVEVLNSLLGSFSDTAPGISNATAIGARAKVSQSNSLVLGSIAGVNNANADTNVGIGTTTPTARLHVVGNGLFTGSLSANQFNFGNLRFLSTSGSLYPNSNVFLGVDAGVSNTPGANADGNQNNFVGNQAGFFNTTGGQNNFFGWSTGRSNSTGSENTFFGNNAGGSNTGSQNSVFGGEAGAVIGAANGNSFFGFYSGHFTTGGNNSFFGYGAGQTNGDGTLNTALGNFADVGSASLTNATALGAGAHVDESNALILGSSNTAVGIGTTTPNSFIGGPARLAIMQLTSGQWTQHIRTNNFGAGSSFGLLIDAGTNASDRAFRIRSQAGNDVFSVRGDGLVGIGTDTPNAQLHISSSSTGSTSLTLENLVGQTSRQAILSNYGSTGGGNYWPGLNSANTSSLLGPNLFVLRSTGGLVFSGSSTAEHMRIDTNGNVAIGTAPGGYRFQVSQTTPNAFAANVQTAGLPTGSSYGLVVSAGTDSGDSAMQIRDQAGNPIMRVRGDGTVGIGTTNPLAKLHVVGDTSLNGNATVTGGLTVGGTVSITGQLNVHTMVTVGTSQVCLNGDLFTRCSSSSLRYKTNVGSFNEGLGVISRLRPITFVWKADGRSDFGLGAEEVEKVAPELVFYRDGQVEGVKYDRIGVVLINAVKEQQVQILNQQQQLKRQQEEITRQEDQARQERAMIAAQQLQIDALKKLVCSSHPRGRACHR